MSDEIQMMMEREAGAPQNVPQLGVGFFVRPVQHAKQSKLAGHPVFVDREWFVCVIPGDRNSRIERPATDVDKKRFPQTYAAFKAAEHQAPVNGFRIEEWPQISRAQAWTFKAAHIYTVEALAEVGDGHIDKLGQSGRELRSKAQAFVAMAKDTAAVQAIKAESDRKDATLADMQRQINELATQLSKRGKAAMVA